MRWRIDGHPLYENALLKLNLGSLEDRSCHKDSVVTQSNAQRHFDITPYQSVVYPSKRDLYTKLNNLFKAIERAAINNGHQCKLLTMNLLAFQRSLHGDGRADFVFRPYENCISGLDIESAPVLPPRKRERGADDVNRHFTGEF